jgi:hypothetical protein
LLLERGPGSVHPTRARRIGWWVVAVTSLLVGAYALGMAASNFAFLPAEVAANRFPTGVLLKVHIIASGIALVTGPFQFVRRFRRRRPAAHRALGRTYVFACLVGGLAGGTIALFSASGLVAGSGFFLLALAWLFCTVRAWRAVLAHDYAGHQRWMMRSFSLTFGAVMLRVYIPLALAMGFTFAQAYPLIAWLAWVPNLVLAQRLIKRPAPI